MLRLNSPVINQSASTDVRATPHTKCQPNWQRSRPQHKTPTNHFTYFSVLRIGLNQNEKKNALPPQLAINKDDQSDSFPLRFYICIRLSCLISSTTLWPRVSVLLTRKWPVSAPFATWQSVWHHWNAWQSVQFSHIYECTPHTLHSCKLSNRVGMTEKQSPFCVRQCEWATGVRMIFRKLNNKQTNTLCIMLL